MPAAIKVAREFSSVVTGRIRRQAFARECPCGTSWHNRNFKVSLVLKSEENSAPFPTSTLYLRPVRSTSLCLSLSLSLSLSHYRFASLFVSQLSKNIFARSWAAMRTPEEKNSGKLYRRLNDGTYRRLTWGKIRLVPAPLRFLATVLQDRPFLARIPEIYTRETGGDRFQGDVSTAPAISLT